jgi:ABC-2 type transport system permease protein
MKDIFINEWKGLLRNSLFLYLSFIIIVSLGLVTWLGIVQNNKQTVAHESAHKHIRSQWDEMKPTNPHGAAHFGSYAFKHTDVLNSIDEGIHAVTGNVLRLEGHAQNDLVYSEVSQSLLISKFGKLKPSLFFQFVIPLLLIFLSFNTFTKERDSGRLKLLLIQGVELKNLVLAKLLSVWLLGVLLLLFAISIQLIFNSENFGVDTLVRLSILTSGYATYYFIITALTILLSILFKNATASLAITLAIWTLWTIFIPKIAGNVVEKLSPLPTRVAFSKAMEEDRSKGIDGHNPTGEREEELKKATLKQYNVDSLPQLPINYDGLVMQADEEYGNKVWDKHFGNLYGQLQSQKKQYQLSGIINPFASTHNISMGSAGTDMFHHLDFLKQAENYRRKFIKTLNDKHAYGGSKTGDWDWKADNAFFKSVEDFEYQTPPINTFSSKYLIDVLVLFSWVICLLTLIYYSSKRVSEL